MDSTVGPLEIGALYSKPRMAAGFGRRKLRQSGRAKISMVYSLKMDYMAGRLAMTIPLLQPGTAGDVGTRKSRTPQNQKPEYLRAVAFANSGQSGWAVGTNGKILRTKDGENWEAWSPQTRSTSEEDLNSVAVTADGHHGWAVGNKGMILKWDDSRQQWIPKDRPTDHDLYGVVISPDGQHGWAVGHGGDRGTILELVTGDKGDTWQAQESPATDFCNVRCGVSLGGVSLADEEQFGWIVGSGSTILRTKNGKWTVQRISASDPLNGIAVDKTGSRGWVVGDVGTILATKDGGNNWEAQTRTTSENLNGVAFAADGRLGWAVGNHGMILKWDDSHKQWIQKSGQTDHNLHGVAFSPDGQCGWAVGKEGEILVAKDNGEQWKEQASGTKQDLNSVAVAEDGRHNCLAIAVGYDGTILKTEDGGDHWNPQNSGTRLELKSVAIAAGAADDAWAVGVNGKILATTNGGKNWDHQISGTSDDLSSVAVSAGGWRAWAVGENGTILATKNKGKTWEPQENPNSDATLYGVSATPDGAHSVAVGARGILLQVSGIAFDKNSVTVKKNPLATEFTLSFALPDNSWLPIWAVHFEGITKGREKWEPIGLRIPGSRDGSLTFNWFPAEHSFRSGDDIVQRVGIYAGGKIWPSVDLDSEKFNPWSARIFQEAKSEAVLLWGKYPNYILIFAIICALNFYYLLMWVCLPARLAEAGAWIDEIREVPNPFVKLLWAGLRLGTKMAVLRRLSRSGKVRRAWAKRYAAGSELNNLNQFARERFVNEPEILDTWVTARLGRVQDALNALELYRQRQIYVQLPVKVGKSQVVEQPSRTMLSDTFKRRRAVVCVVGAGGGGKSTLACAIARWAMADDPMQRLADHRMIPVFIAQDTSDLPSAVTRGLIEMLGDEECRTT